MSRNGQSNNWLVGNPFEESRQRVSVYTAQEIATLQSRLEKQLGPEYISSRAGPGGKKVHYLATEKCINLANEVFGFNGWSSSVREVQVDFVDEHPGSGKISLGLSAVVRITLKDGAYHEDLGYGHMENCKDKAAAFEKAKKEAVSDARKRALRNFGNLLGNCVYDKDFLAKVTRVKPEPVKFNPDDLHRQPDYIYVKREPAMQVPAARTSKTAEQAGSVVPATKASKNPEQADPGLQDAEDEFGSCDFDEADFSVPDAPDETALGSTRSVLSRTNSATNMNDTQQRPVSVAANKSNPQSHGQMVTPAATNGMNTNGSRVQPVHQAPSARGAQLAQLASQSARAIQAAANTGTSRPAQVPPSNVSGGNGNGRPGHGGPHNGVASNGAGSRLAQAPQSHTQPVGEMPPPPMEIIGEINTGFFPARVAEAVQSGPKAAVDNKAFDPKLDSPSIRKTVGFDHSSSKPTKRESLVGAESPGGGARTPGKDFVNPHLDPNRRLNLPAVVPSPNYNRHTFKRPQMVKRPADQVAPERSALGEVTGNSMNATLGGPEDLKRPKIEQGEFPGNVV